MQQSKIVPVFAVVTLSLFVVPFIAAPKLSLQPVPQPRVQSTIPPSGIGNNLSVKAQSAEGGMWRNDGTFSPTFMLMNGLVNTPMNVTPVLYMADGTEYDLPQVQLDPSGVAMINIVNALREAPPNIQSHISTYGSAATRFQWAWPVVGAAILNRDQVRSLVYQTHLESDANFTHDPNAVQSSQVLQSTWWKQEPDVTGFLSLTNTSLNPVALNVKLSDGGAEHSAIRQLSLASHNTTWIDLSQLWAQLPGGAITGGIDISYVGVSNAISASGGLEDDAKGYSQMLHFWQRMQMAPVASNTNVLIGANSTQPATTLDSTGIMMGAQDADIQFPQGTTFAPYMILRNTTANPLSVQLAVNTMSGTNPTDASLAPVTLAALESRQIDMKSLLQTAGLNAYNGYINLRTSFAGNMGDLLAETGSIDPSFNYVFEVPAHLEQETGSRLFNYWNTNGDTDSMFTLWNYSNTTQDLVLTFYHQEGKYELPIHLTPHASMTMSVGKLIRGGVPDLNGNVIPASIVQGSAKLSGQHSNREPINVAVFGGTFNSRTGTCYYVCQHCNGVVSSSTDPSSMTLFSGGSGASLTLTITFYDLSTEDVTEEVTLDSSNSTVATVAGSAVSPGIPGNATISGTHDYRGIGYDGTDYSCSGCTTYEANFSCTVSVKPFLGASSPSSIAAGSSNVPVTLTGTGFSGAIVVNLPSGFSTTGITSSTSTEINLPISVSGSVAAGGYDVSVTVNSKSSDPVSITVTTEEANVVSRREVTKDLVRAPQRKILRAGRLRAVRRGTTTSQTMRIDRDPAPDKGLSIMEFARRIARISSLG